jgi:hypothetical protein
MSKLISLNGLPDGLAKSFKTSVDPMDVIVGAAIEGVIGPTINKKLWDPTDGFLKSLVAADGFLADTSAGVARDWPAYVRKALSTVLLAGAAYLVQKGSKRAQGHVVGIVGYATVDTFGQKVRDMLPASFQGLVEFNQMSILTQDDAYGILTADSAYGETTAHQMASFQAATADMTESDPEAEYA